MNGVASRRGVRALARVTASALLLASCAWLLDLREIGDVFQKLDLTWVFWALGAYGAQILLCAQRWRFTAARLGAPLEFAHATREYFLSTLLNQVLPGGVLGDVGRALRHGAAPRSATAPGVGLAAAAVVLERAAGQLALLLVALGTVPLWLQLIPDPRANLGWLVVGLGAALACVIVATRLGGFAATAVEQARRALWARGALVIQLGLSMAGVAAFLLHFYFSARALGLELPLRTLLRVFPWVLAAMALPACTATRSSSTPAPWPTRNSSRSPARCADCLVDRSTRSG